MLQEIYMDLRLCPWKKLQCHCFIPTKMASCFSTPSCTHLLLKLLCACTTTLNSKAAEIKMVAVGTMLESITNWEEPSSGGLMEACPVRFECSSIIKWQHFSCLHTAWPSSGLQHGGFAAIHCKTTGDTARVFDWGGCYQLEGLGVMAAEPQVSGKSIGPLM